MAASFMKKTMAYLGLVDDDYDDYDDYDARGPGSVSARRANGCVTTEEADEPGSCRAPRAASAR